MALFKWSRSRTSSTETDASSVTLDSQEEVSFTDNPLNVNNDATPKLSPYPDDPFTPNKKQSKVKENSDHTIDKPSFNQRLKGAAKFLGGAAIVAAAGAAMVLSSGIAGLVIGAVAMIKPTLVKKPFEMMQNGIKEIITGKSSAKTSEELVKEALEEMKKNLDKPKFTEAKTIFIDKSTAVSKTKRDLATSFGAAAIGFGAAGAAMVLSHGIAALPMAAMCFSKKGREILKEPFRQFKRGLGKVQALQNFKEHPDFAFRTEYGTIITSSNIKNEANPLHNITAISNPLAIEQSSKSGDMGPPLPPRNKIKKEENLTLGNIASPLPPRSQNKKNEQSM